MTTSCPSIGELVDAVRDFLQHDVQPALENPAAFQARVAVNALGIVARDLEQGDAARSAEAARLRTLLAKDGDLGELNRELCRRLRDGEIDYSDRSLLDHLRQTTTDRMAIDNPRYATYRRWIDADAR